LGLSHKLDVAGLTTTSFNYYYKSLISDSTSEVLHIFL